MLKAYEIKQANALRFEELGVKVFWEIVCSDPELKIYFPDYKDSVYQRESTSWICFSLSKRCRSRYDQRSSENQKIDNEPDEDQKVEIKKDFLQEILETNFGSGKSLQV